MNNEIIAKKILQHVGGANNVKNVYHCATRLRFTLHHGSTVDIEALKEIKGVINVLGNGTQIQVVIGNAVNKVYNELQEYVSNEEHVSHKTDEKGRLIDRVFNVISGIFAPYLPLIMCSGIVTGLLTLATSMNWLDASSGTYAILSSASNAVFYFFPILLAYTAAKQFKTNPYIAVVIGAAIMHPTFTALTEVEGNIGFFGIPVVMASYASSVIPAILGVWFYSVIDHQLTKILPDSIRSLIITLVGIVVVVPLTILTFGPFGTYVSQLLGDGLSSLVNLNPFIAGAIGGGLCGYLGVFGLQWGIIPIIIINISNQGFDYFTPMWLMATYAQIGLALGVFLKTKNTELKQLSITSFITGLFTGITEPIIYGLLTKYKRLHIPFITAGALAGAFVGVMGVKQYTFVFAGILNFPGFIGDTFTYYIIGMVLAIVIAAVLTYLLGYEDSLLVLHQNEKDKDFSLTAPVQGRIISITDVSDEVFSKKTLGDGIAIIPSDGKVYAPMDGILEVVYPTGHAYGLKNENGIEILLHIGIDTVDLNGEGFHVKVSQGKRVKKGDLLVEFDLDVLMSKKIDPTVLLIMTTLNDYVVRRMNTDCDVTTKDEIVNLV